MKMKTDRGKRKVGRRLGLPAAKRKDTIRRVSLHPPVEGNALPPEPEAPEPEVSRPPERETPTPGGEEARRSPDDEQS